MAPRTHRTMSETPGQRGQEHDLDQLAALSVDLWTTLQALKRIAKVRRAKTAREIANDTLEEIG